LLFAVCCLLFHFPFDFGLPIDNNTTKEQRTNAAVASFRHSQLPMNCRVNQQEARKNRQNHHDSDSDSMAKPSSVIHRPSST
jgi:hypothetical protein